jgi:hypothetical protein
MRSSSISSQINVPYLKPDPDTMNGLFILSYTVIEIHQKELSVTTPYTP